MNIDHRHVLIGQLYERVWLNEQKMSEMQAELTTANATIEHLKSKLREWPAHPEEELGVD